jgi:hypothetical protein
MQAEATIKTWKLDKEHMTPIKKEINQKKYKL